MPHDHDADYLRHSAEAEDLLDAVTAQYGSYDRMNAALLIGMAKVRAQLAHAAAQRGERVD